MIIFGRVYDITTFAITHPGFENAGQVSTALAITRNLGKDCTEEFEYTHSLTAWKQLADFQIGVLAACAKGKDCPHCCDLENRSEISVKPDEDSVNCIPARHPLPNWLPDEVVDFWNRLEQGVTNQLRKYLQAAGYPQRRIDCKT